MSLPPSSSSSYSRPGAVSDAVDEATIRAVVDDFYSRVREDDLLGPVFAARVDDWSQHLPKMYGFWATVVRGERRYHGNPLEAHRPIAELSVERFERWLNLFEATLRDHCEPADAEAWALTARRMAFAMSHRLGLVRNEVLLP